MKRPCNYKDCGSRRAHWETPDVSRGTQYIEVPDDYPTEKPVYCSITCACMDGSYNINTGWIDKEKKN